MSILKGARIASLGYPSGRGPTEEPGEEPFESYSLAQPVEVYTFFRRLALEPVGEGTLERLRGRVLHDGSSGLLADHSTMSWPCE
jgi:hypothetical protein